MKHRLIYTLGFIILAIVVFGAIPAAAQTVANGPYYATPSWDQKLACTSSSNCPRFIVLSNWNNEAVLDRETGLIWERSPNSSVNVTWSAAQAYCNNLTVGNRMGWRVPTIQELTSLVDRSVASPGIPLPSGHPFLNVQGVYWSATKDANDPGSGWILINNRGVELEAVTVVLFSNAFVWCVRGGQGVDPQ